MIDAGHVWIEGSSIGAGPGLYCAHCAIREGDERAHIQCVELSRPLSPVIHVKHEYDPFNAEPEPFRNVPIDRE